MTAARDARDPRAEPDPAALARYRAELRHHAQGTRYAGFALAVLGIAVALVRSKGAPWIPELLPVTLIVLAMGLMLLGTIRRTRYHLRRLRDGLPR